VSTCGNVIRHIVLSCSVSSVVSCSLTATLDITRAVLNTCSPSILVLNKARASFLSSSTQKKFFENAKQRQKLENLLPKRLSQLWTNFTLPGMMQINSWTVLTIPLGTQINCRGGGCAHTLHSEEGDISPHAPASSDWCLRCST